MTTAEAPPRALPVISAHAGGLVRRAAGAIVHATGRGERATAVGLGFGERAAPAKGRPHGCQRAWDRPPDPRADGA
ncbi:hypothetical protein [Nonomuraea sp. NPDC049309]|uniref:hypothetical protein n=1 Tax=Nonomuraea sp. NPDC049309 TaxID=3364350 RepID=UPI00371123F5